jgi:uncharacterized protein (DUF488 family)
MNTLFTVGYGAWAPAQRLSKLIAALKSAGIKVLIDVRHSPCSAVINPDSFYGPKPWSLQADGGIREVLESEGISYVWLVELGNPQKNDPQMQVLKAHLADPNGDWPVHRGLARLAELVRTNPANCCIMCACERFQDCHRRLIAEALQGQHFADSLDIRHIPRSTDRH